MIWTSPLEEAAKASERLAAGDLSVRLTDGHSHRADEIGHALPPPFLRQPDIGG